MNPLVQKVLSNMEDQLNGVVDAESKKFVDGLIQKICALIPGPYDDAFLASLEPIILEALVGFAKAQIDKLDGEVG